MGKYALDTFQLHQLDRACMPLTDIFGRCVYLVGTANAYDTSWHDVDVRVILDDRQFDRLFHNQPQFWSLVNFLIADSLRKQTGLPIDFQIQRRTEANANHTGPRNPLGTGRLYAGGGDATNLDSHARHGR